MSGSKRSSLRRYLSAVDRKYSAMRGIPAALSPRDVALVIDWFERGIPAALVLRTLDEVAVSHQRGGTADQPIRSLRFAQRALEKNFRAHMLLVPERSRGADAGFGAAKLSASLESIATRLAAGVLADREEVGAIVAQLRAKAAALVDPVTMTRVERLEKELTKIDEQLGELVGAACPGELDTARQEATVGLEPYREAMGAQRYDVALEKRARAAARRAVGVPRASLFFVDSGSDGES